MRRRLNSRLKHQQRRSKQEMATSALFIVPKRRNHGERGHHIKKHFGSFPRHPMEEKLSEANLLFQIVPGKGKISCEDSGSFQICCQICWAEVEVSVYRRTPKSGTLYSPKFQKFKKSFREIP